MKESTLRRWADDSLIRSVFNMEPAESDSVLCKILKRGSESQRSKSIGPNSKSKRSSTQEAAAPTHHKEDLQGQIQHLQTAFPEHEIVSDVGSGLNFKRKGFTSLLEQEVFDEIGKEVVVMQSDQLCQHETELVESIFEKTGTGLLVDGEHETTSTQELADDLLAITTVFVARITESSQPPIENAVDNKSRNQPAKEFKTHKIRVYPSKKLDSLLRRWFGAARWTYNRCVASLKKKDCKMNKMELRQLHVIEAALLYLRCLIKNDWISLWLRI